MFFNKSRFTVVKLNDQVQVVPDASFSIPVLIADDLGLTPITSVTCSILKTMGRDLVQLPTVLTYTLGTVSGTIASTDWDGITQLQLKVTINLYQIVTINLKV